MITFLSLSGENVGTYKSLKLDLNTPGFVLLAGKSGAGKSTLFRLISFLLYGRISADNKQKADLYHPKRTAFLGEIEFTVDDTHYKVRRARKHPKYKTGVWVWRHGQEETPYTEKDALRKIQTILGMTWEDFVTAVYLPQKFGHMMIQGTPSQRWDYITALAGCQSIDTLIDRVKARANDPHYRIELETLIRERDDLLQDSTVEGEDTRSITDHVKRLRRDLRKVDRTLDRTVSAIEEMEKYLARKRAREEIRASLPAKAPRKPKHDLEDLRNRLADLTRRIEQEETNKEIRKELESLETASLRELRSEHRKLVRRSGEVEAELVHTKSTLREFQDLDDLCSTCLQPITKSHKRKVGAEALALLAELQAEANRIEEQIELLDARMTSAQKADRLRARLQPVSLPKNAKAKASKLSFTILKVKDQTRDWEEYTRVKARLDRLPVLRRPGKVSLSKLKGIASSLRSERSKLQADLTYYNNQLSVLQDRQKRAEAIQSRIEEAEANIRKQVLLSAACKALHDVKRDRVAHTAQAFSDTANRFMSDSRSDRFEVDLGKQKFDLRVRRSEDREEGYSLPVRVLSGGEGDKASAAFLLAAQKIAAAKKRTNLLMLDEPCAHTDGDAWAEFLDRVSVLDDGKRTIIISTHVESAKNANIWKKTVKVRKVKGVSFLG